MWSCKKVLGAACKAHLAASKTIKKALSTFNDHWFEADLTLALLCKASDITALLGVLLEFQIIQISNNSRSLHRNSM